MKNFWFLFLGLAFACSSSSENESSSELAFIEGLVQHIPVGAKARLGKIENNKPVYIDSSEISKEGAFSLKAPSDTERLYLLEIGAQRLPVFLEKGEHKLTADFNDLYPSARYTQSPLTDLMRQVEGSRVAFEKKAQELEMTFRKSMAYGNKAAADSAYEAFLGLQKSTKLYIKHFIDSVGPGPVSHLATSMLSVDEDFGYLDSLGQRFSRERPNAVFTKKLNAYLEVPRKLAIGKPAPEVAVTDPAGKPIQLSQFRGKWVLLDFWASWCKPCRAETPNLIAAMKNYKAKGFTVFSVSLDRDKEAWMKTMVGDKMYWAHGIEAGEFDGPSAKAYFVNAIPATFLIDPMGNIAAKNLRGQALADKLRQVLP